MSRSLRILFQARRYIFTIRGGDTTQFEMTRRFLQKRGLDVDVHLGFRNDCRPYDIVHLFNTVMPYYTNLQAGNVRSQQKPVCLSTIFWNAETIEAQCGNVSPAWSRAGRSLKRACRSALSCVSENARITKRELDLMRVAKEYRLAQGRLIDAADMLLPNSDAELQDVLRAFPGAFLKPAAVVVYGFDQSIFSPVHVNDSKPPAEISRECVLCVGRLEPRKNQKRLLKAMAGTSMPVVLVGGTNSRTYAREVSGVLQRKDRWMKEVPHESMPPIYSAARVHVLASFFETAGLVSLEAGAMGCNLVVPDIPTQREYFGDHAEYCDPSSEESILHAVERALAKPWPNNDLAAFIRSRYSWEKAAEQTHGAYMRLLDG